MTVDGPVSVVQTGAANVASVCAALRRIGVQPRLTSSAAELRTPTPVILPGVGAFGPAMRRLADHGLDEVLRERVRAGYSTCAICLGMQLLCEASEESPEVSGLGVIAGRVERFPDSVRVPQLG
ncbi:MAG: imidazole glycerol phosphate synthase subunit HisH, partial [bacterium]|nr:imidazole glycerol phosphate synthase subunit HisH [bacterium]